VERGGRPLQATGVHERIMELLTSVGTPRIHGSVTPRKITERVKLGESLPAATCLRATHRQALSKVTCLRAARKQGSRFAESGHQMYLKLSSGILAHPGWNPQLSCAKV